MKILFCPTHRVFDDKTGISEAHEAYSIAHRLSLHFTGATIITGVNKAPPNINYTVVEIDTNIDYTDYSPLAALVYTLRFTYYGIRAVRKEKFDVIQHIRPFAFGSSFNLIPFFNPNKNTKFVIGTFGSTYKTGDGDRPAGFIKTLVEGVMSFLIKPILKQLSIITIKKADAIVVYDNYTKEQLLPYISPEKVFPIPVGKDGAKYPFNANRVFTEDIRLICVGGLIPRKQVDLVIKALAHINKRTKNVYLDVAGAGPMEDELKELALSLGIQERVVFHGFVPHEKVIELYGTSHLFVHMASEESFGHVYIEALASGLPVVSFDNVASKSILTSETSLILNQSDPNELASLLLGAIENPEHLRAMSYACRKRFDITYDWETVIIPQYVEIYSNLTKNSQA